MGRNLIKKRGGGGRKRKGEVYYNFKGLANGAECPIVGRPTRNHRTRVRMVEYLAREGRTKKRGKETPRKRERERERGRDGDGERIAQGGEKDKRGRLRNDGYFRSARHSSTIVSAIPRMFPSLLPRHLFYLAFNPTDGAPIIHRPPDREQTFEMRSLYLL